MKFSAVGIFKHNYENPNRISKFEERVVITEASSQSEAEKQVLSEFEQYAQNGIEFIGEFVISEVIEEEVVTEVASTMRIFEGSAEDYLDQHWYDLQPESCDERGWHHVWYNKGNGKSACYNCQEIRDGKLW